MSCRSRITLSTKLKQLVLRSIECNSVMKACNAFNSGKYVFLMYHGVARDDNTHAQNDWLQLNESSFREQMLFLKQHYNVVSIKDILTNTVDTLDKRPKVVITFDDGYANNYNVAFPILKELQIPATIFLVTSMINTNKLFWYDRLFISLQRHTFLKQVLEIIEQFKHCHSHIVNEKVDDFFKTHTISSRVPESAFENYRILSYREINEMASSGLITFGSHTHQHELLTLLTDREVTYTLTKSYEILQDIPEKVDVFCYPNGYFDKTHVALCQDAGYNFAVTTSGGIWTRNTPDLEIPRWGVGRGMSIGNFSTIVSGALYLLRILTLRATT